MGKYKDFLKSTDKDSVKEPEGVVGEGPAAATVTDTPTPPPSTMVAYCAGCFVSFTSRDATEASTLCRYCKAPLTWNPA